MMKNVASKSNLALYYKSNVFTLFLGIGKPIFDCDTLDRYKKPPCGVYQTHGGHVWVRTYDGPTFKKNLRYFPVHFSSK